MSPRSTPTLCPKCGGTYRGRCTTCNPPWSTGRRTKRKYPTSHRTWRNLRAAVLRDEPLCRTCKAEGLATLAVEVDHIVPVEEGGPELDRRNLQPLCHDHHAAKTQAEATRGKGRSDDQGSQAGNPRR